MVRFRRVVLAAAFYPSSRPVAWSSILRAIATSASAAHRSAVPRHPGEDLGNLVRRFGALLGVEPHRTSARRILALSGRPRASLRPKRRRGSGDTLEE